MNYLALYAYDNKIWTINQMDHKIFGELKIENIFFL
jgi:hypothetical protein